MALKLSTSPSRLQISAQFIGVPEIALSTKCLAKVKVITSCIDLSCVVVWKHKLHDLYMELQDVLIYAVLWFGKHKLLDSYVEYSVTLSDE